VRERKLFPYLRDYLTAHAHNVIVHSLILTCQRRSDCLGSFYPLSLTFFFRLSNRSIRIFSPFRHNLDNRSCRPYLIFHPNLFFCFGSVLWYGSFPPAILRFENKRLVRSTRVSSECSSPPEIGHGCMLNSSGRRQATAGCTCSR